MPEPDEESKKIAAYVWKAMQGLKPWGVWAKETATTWAQRNVDAAFAALKESWNTPPERMYGNKPPNVAHNEPRQRGMGQVPEHSCESHDRVF